MSRTVGIDFGTTNSVIAVLEGGEPVVIPNHRGERLTPSVVAFTNTGNILTGTAARSQSIMNYEHTVMSVKRKFGSNFSIDIYGESYSAEQIASIIIGKLKESAEEFTGGPVTQAIITVPAYFNDGQRNSVKKAGELAGLEVLRLINEPTAAALSYNLPRGETGTILVFDLGGGTFDVSILDISDTVYEVTSTRGNNRLGGDDFDAVLIQHICKSFYAENKIDLREDRMALQKIRDAAEQAKKELSESGSTNIAVPFISADEDGPRHLDMTVTRADFENLIFKHLEELGALVDGALEDSGIDADDVSAAILVGGSTRIPAVRRILENKFPGRVMKTSNPDECVAAGAAIQAGIITGSVKGLVLVDVTPLTLGIQAENNIFVPIIERNSCIPTGESKIFTTVADSQSAVEVHVLQGERTQANLNYSLGRFTLEGIEPQPRGAARIEVSFDIDVNGLVRVSARDKTTGLEKRIEITPSDSMDEENMKKHLRDAQEHREEDEIFVGQQKLLKQANTLLDILKNRPGLEDDPERGAEIAELVQYIEQALNSNDAQQIRNAVETINVYLGDMAVA